MKVLVTGHRGYIGAVLCRQLLEHGDDVVGIDTGYYEDCDFLEPPLPVPSIRRDVRDLQAPDLAGFAAVIHLAALSNDPLGQLDTQLTEAINHRASLKLAELARAAGVERFIFSSSCSMYGSSDADAAVAEDAPLQPISAYACSKVDAERGIAALADDSFAPVFLRNATAYGMSPRLRVDLVLTNLVGSALASGEVKVLSDGSPWRPLVHVEDIAGAMLAVLRAPRQVICNQAFNIGRDADNYQVREIAEIVRDTVPGARIRYAGSGEPDRRSYRVSFAKAKQQLIGFAPRWDVQRGARETYDTLRRAGFDATALDSSKYTRLKQLNALRSAGRLDGALRWVRT